MYGSYGQHGVPGQSQFPWELDYIEIMIAKSHLPSAVSRVLNGNVSAPPPPGSLPHGGL